MKRRVILALVVFCLVICSVTLPFSVFADDVVEDLSTQVPTGRLFLSFDSTNDFTRYTPTSSGSAGYLFYNSYNVNVPGGLIYKSALFQNLKYSEALEFTEGFVYKLEFDFAFRAGTVATYDPSNLRLAFPYISNINNGSSYQRSTLLNSIFVSYYPTSWTPASVNSYHMVYTIYFNPATFDRYLSKIDDYYKVDQIALVDDSGNLDSAWEDQIIQQNIRVITAIESARAVRLSPEEAQTEILSQEIQNQTAQIISRFESPLPSFTPSPEQEVIEYGELVLHEGLESLTEDFSLTYPYSSNFLNGLSPGTASIVSDWLQYFYEHNQFLFIILTGAFASFLFVTAMRELY